MTTVSASDDGADRAAGDVARLKFDIARLYHFAQMKQLNNTFYIRDDPTGDVDPFKFDLARLYHIAQLEGLLSYAKHLSRRAGNGELTGIRFAWVLNVAWTLAFQTEVDWPKPGDLTAGWGYPDGPSAVALASKFSPEWRQTFHKFHREPEALFTKFSRGRSLAVVHQQSLVSLGDTLQLREKKAINDWFPKPPRYTRHAFDLRARDVTLDVFGQARAKYMEDEEEADNTGNTGVLAARYNSVFQSLSDTLFAPGRTVWDRDLDLAPPIVDEASQKKTKDPNPIFMVIGAYLVIESAQSFVWPDRNNEKYNRVNCRMMAVKFARELLDCLTALHLTRSKWGLVDLSCSWENPGENSDEATKLLKKFCVSLDLSLLSQSPWVAFNHTLYFYNRIYLPVAAWMLEKERFVIGHVLFFYVACRAYGTLQEDIPILDALCDFFLDEIFSGVLPKLGEFGPTFVKCKKAWDKPIESMGVYQEGVRIGKAKFGTYMDPLSLDKDSDFVKEFISLVTAEPDANISSVIQNPWWIFLEKMNRFIGPEFEGSFPSAKVNFIEIFHKCLTFWTSYAQALEFQRESDMVSGVYLLKLTSEVFERVIPDLEQAQPNTTLLAFVAIKIKEVFGEGRVEDYLFKNL